LKPSVIFLSPSHNRLHYSRQFFEWLQDNHLNIPVILHFRYACSQEDLLIQAPAECGALLCDGLGDGVWLEGPYEISFLRTIGNGMVLIMDELKSIKNIENTLLKLKGKIYRTGTDINFVGTQKDSSLVERKYNWNAFDLGASSFQDRLNVDDILECIQDIEDYDKAVQALMDRSKIIRGSLAFTLNDTFGFPIDLTELVAREDGFKVDINQYNLYLNEQKSRSKVAATKEIGDWILIGADKKTEFIGYENLESEIRIVKYRKIKQKNKELFQLVFDTTPFYAESGGQVGDTGVIESVNEKIFITDTKKENELIVHFAEKLPESFTSTFLARVDVRKRELTMDNHSATHLLHASLRQILGKHVEQKGSLVNEKILRFDFSHFAAMTPEEISKVETMVNERIRENISLNEQRNVPIEKAKSFGAMALFGEKYGDFVRVITFDPKFSVELCGGTHVSATGKIGLFKIISESSVAAGVRRIEAVTAEGAQEFVDDSLAVLNELKTLLKNPKDISASLQNLIEEKHSLEKKLELMYQQQANILKDELARKAVKSNGHTLILEKVQAPNADSLKNIAYALRNQFEDLLLVLAADVDSKPQVTVMIGEKLAATNKFHAGNMVKELAKEIDGGGGGQPFFATAGGKNLNGLDAVLVKAKTMF
ncbi:MAG: hypothetical protein HY015_10190, partial [Bacteroidetes bacterium]|nr:hypothetical protein [Bacteroidota bacterium]